MARSDRRAREAQQRGVRRQAALGARRASMPLQAQPVTLYIMTAFLLDISKLDEGALA